ncbi:recombination regulator RecX [Chitinimonas sp. BJYL2]|uniref:recombination regulator RecX n=1 Tax=Chitinimonas sp. BJYL2 TaxID=2976696 RepID=UPI0022B47DB2|nr:recombination regulator RecX [Chitinimonas sp. BJYL2]
MSELRNKALKLLNGREHSRAELRRKLISRVETSDSEVDALLDELEGRNWLSDARFAAAYVSAHAARFGKLRIQHDLRERGVADALIETALAAMNEEDDELSRARNVWQKKFTALPQDARERGRQIRFLQARGFGFDVIRRVLGGLGDD